MIPYIDSHGNEASETSLPTPLLKSASQNGAEVKKKKLSKRVSSASKMQLCELEVCTMPANIVNEREEKDAIVELLQKLYVDIFEYWKSPINDSNIKYTSSKRIFAAAKLTAEKGKEEDIDHPNRVIAIARQLDYALKLFQRADGLGINEIPVKKEGQISLFKLLEMVCNSERCQLLCKLEKRKIFLIAEMALSLKFKDFVSEGAALKNFLIKGGKYIAELVQLLGRDFPVLILEDTMECPISALLGPEGKCLRLIEVFQFNYELLMKSIRNGKVEVILYSKLALNKGIKTDDAAHSFNFDSADNLFKIIEGSLVSLLGHILVQSSNFTFEGIKSFLEDFLSRSVILGKISEDEARKWQKVFVIAWPTGDNKDVVVDYESIAGLMRALVDLIGEDAALFKFTLFIDSALKMKTFDAFCHFFFGSGMKVVEECVKNLGEKRIKILFGYLHSKSSDFTFEEMRSLMKSFLEDFLSRSVILGKISQDEAKRWQKVFITAWPIGDDKNVVVDYESIVGLARALVDLIGEDAALFKFTLYIDSALKMKTTDAFCDLFFGSGMKEVEECVKNLGEKRIRTLFGYLSEKSSDIEDNDSIKAKISSLIQAYLTYSI